MKVSVITATYNSENTIQRTIDSVIGQDYKDIEYIIIDGGSTDRTIHILEENTDKISYFISEKDNGIYDALNKGIKLATGDIIGFLNSDDVYYSQCVVSRIVSFFENEKSDVVYGNLIYQSRKVGENKIIRFWESNLFDIKLLKFGWMPPHPTLYCTKNVYDVYGLYNTEYRISADYDFILRVFKQNSLKKTYIPQILVKMDVGGVSNNSFSNICIKSKEDYLSITRNGIGGITTLLLKNIRKIRQFIKAHY